MKRVVIIAGLWLFGIVSACGTPEEVANIEAAEDAEWTVGNERAMVQSEEGGEVGGYLTSPNAEEDIEMANEPYPE